MASFETVVLCALFAIFAFTVWIINRKIPRVVRTLRKGNRTKGHIIREDTVRFDLISTLLYFPVISFRDESGVLHEVKTRFHRYRQTPIRDQMQEVDIAYMPDNPKETAVLTGIRFYIPTAIRTISFMLLLCLLPMLIWQTLV